MKSFFSLLYSHKYSINLQLGIRESKLNSSPKGPYPTPLGLSKPHFLLGTPWKGDPEMCELYSFAQRKVFVLKSKRLWLLVAISLGPKQRAHLRDMLSGIPLHCLANSYFCSINSLYSTHSRKPTFISPLLYSPGGPRFLCIPTFHPHPLAYHSADHILL